MKYFFPDNFNEVVIFTTVFIVPRFIKRCRVDNVFGEEHVDSLSGRLQIRCLLVLSSTTLTWQHEAKTLNSIMLFFDDYFFLSFLFVANAFLIGSFPQKNARCVYWGTVVVTMTFNCQHQISAKLTWRPHECENCLVTPRRNIIFRQNLCKSKE